MNGSNLFVMKKGILFLLFYVVFFESYSQQRIEGNVGDAQINKIYLFEVVNEFREIYRVIDSAEVHKGNFEFVLNEMTPELYFVGDNLKHGGYFFLDGKLPFTIAFFNSVIFLLFLTCLLYSSSPLHILYNVFPNW